MPLGSYTGESSLPIEAWNDAQQNMVYFVVKEVSEQVVEFNTWYNLGYFRGKAIQTSDMNAPHSNSSAKSSQNCIAEIFTCSSLPVETTFISPAT